MKKWCEGNLTAEIVDKDLFCEEESAEEIKYFKRVEKMRQMISYQFMNLDEGFLDSFIEDYYPGIFETERRHEDNNYCSRKSKRKYYRDALAEYGKRLAKYCRFEVIEVEDEKTPDKASEALEEQIKEKEAERILKHVKEDAHLITLEIQGKKLDSVAFADTIEKLATYGTSHIQFVIGGSLGLHSSVSKRANTKLSFSDMTFPHQLMRVILAEQIYRAYRIISGEPYHK